MKSCGTCVHWHEGRCELSPDLHKSAYDQPCLDYRTREEGWICWGCGVRVPKLPPDLKCPGCASTVWLKLRSPRPRRVKAI